MRKIIMSTGIEIRHLTIGDLEDMVISEAESWPPELRDTRETFLWRFKYFPKGFLGAYDNGRLAGTTFGHPQSKLFRTWEANMREGYDPNGKIFYIVNVGVSEFHRGKGIATSLVNVNKELARELGMEKIQLGARNIPSNIKLYLKCGFKPIETIEDYLPQDREANGVGVIMEYIL